MDSSLQYVNNKIGDTVGSLSHQPIAALSTGVQWGLYRLSLVTSDVGLSLLALISAAWIRFNVPLPIFNLEANPSIPPLPVVIFGFIPLWLIVFTMHGLYQKNTLLGGTQEYSSVFQATAIGMLIVVIFGFIQPIYTPARGWVLLAWIFATLFVIIGRFFLRRVVYYLRRRGYFLSPALIVGDNAEAISLAEQLLLWQTSGFAVLGLVATSRDGSQPAPSALPVVGSIDQLDELVTRLNVGELVLATSALSQDQILAVFKRYGVAPNLNLRLSSGLFEVITTGLQLREVASVPLMRINQVRLTGWDWVLKTTLDLSLAALALLISLPLFGLIALAIRLDSPGKIVYRRKVMGLNGIQFDAYKFRTMQLNGDDILAARPDKQSELEQAHKLKDDPRVTRVGRILRKHSLDELPQFVNVLRREMSVVGPRIITPDELVKYEQWDINLLTVPPGITGLWQVSGRSDLTYAERVQLDMRYVRNWSIWLDLHILMRTILVVIRGEGAY